MFSSGSRKTIGVGVNPMKMNVSVSHPSTIRGQPSGTRSLAVGGCLGPISSRRTTISRYE